MSAAPEKKIRLLAVAVASGQTVRKWARANDVPERTAYRWAATEAFKAQVAALQGEMVRSALGRLTRTSGQAVATLRKLLAASSEGVRLGAARAILQGLIEIQTHADLNARVAELEKQLEQSLAQNRPD